MADMEPLCHRFGFYTPPHLMMRDKLYVFLPDEGGTHLLLEILQQIKRMRFKIH